MSSFKLGERKEPISEAELSLIWEGRRFPAEALATAAGGAIEVVYPGRRNGGPGPDFRDAVVRLAGEERRGDVELHLRASSFRSHGHDADAAYDGVVLHVVYVADEGGETLLSNGALTPVAAFAPWVERRTGELERWLAAPALWQEPCRGAKDRIGDEGVRAALVAAGCERFEARVTSLREEIAASGEAAALWRALLEAMGLGGDREGFRRLADAVDQATAAGLLAKTAVAERAALLETLLLAAGGLIEVPARLDGRLAVMRPRLTAMGRPANRPERRIAAFAKLYERAAGDFVAYAERSVAEAVQVKDLVAAWSAASKGGGAALIGMGRAAELVLNVVLPFVAAARPAFAGRSAELALALPAAPAYGKTAFLERCLVRPDGKRRVRSAVEQQGLLAFLASWCSQGGCGRCPLS